MATLTARSRTGPGPPLPQATGRLSEHGQRPARTVTQSPGLCCIWLTGGMLTLPLPPEHQIANANSLNAHCHTPGDQLVDREFVVSVNRPGFSGG